MLIAAVVGLIWMALVAAWIWHVVDLFVEVDPSELPPRARHWITDRESTEHRRPEEYPGLEGLNANY